MARRSPRSRRKSKPASKLPQSPRVRSTPGKPRAASPRAGHVVKGASRPAPVRKTAGRKKVALAAYGSRRRRFLTPDPVRVSAILEQLHELYPDARCALDFATPLQLLIATILSAQCTDERVNMVTQALFAAYPDAAAFAAADPAALEKAIHSTGFFRNKSKSIREAAGDIVQKHGGEVPRTLEELTALRGAGRKTANVVLGNAFGIPGLVVDTHVTRVAWRLGLTNETDPVKIEVSLMPIVAQGQWTIFSHWLIHHGRRVCIARKPRCSECPLLAHCPQRRGTVQA